MGRLHGSARHAAGRITRACATARDEGRPLWIGVSGAGRARALSAPAPLTAEHDLEQFSFSARRRFDDWLKRRARQNEISGALRTASPRADGSLLWPGGGVRVARGVDRKSSPQYASIWCLGGTPRSAGGRSGWRGKGLGAALLRAMLFSGSSALPGRLACARSSCMRFRMKPRHFTSTRLPRLADRADDTDDHDRGGAEYARAAA